LASIFQVNTKVQDQKCSIHLHLKDSINQVDFSLNLGTPVPGAGNYFPVNDLSDSGKYVLSKNQGNGRRKIDKEFRESFVQIPAKITKSSIYMI
jgi:hypothetical protein